MNNYDILATIDVTSYESLKDLYEDLSALKRDVFASHERILIQYHNSLSLIKEILNFVDIPEYFIIYEKVNNDNGIDFEFSPSHCIYPWINLEIDNLGIIKPCCSFRGTIPNGDLPSSNVNQVDLEKVYLSEFMKNLRASFLKGQQPSGCSKCWEEEQAGIPSMRQWGKHKFRDIYYKIDYQEENFNNLQLLDLKIGNNCNLACKICDKRASSKIAEIEHQSGKISTIEFNKLKETVSWAESQWFWDKLSNTIKNLKYLDIYGGEPLMSKMHFDFLKKLIDIDVAKNIKIDYNTNGTVFSEKFFDLWKHYKEVKLSFSIDDIEERFEEQRVGAKWAVVCENLEKYKSHRSTKFIIELFPTINTQNVYWLPELIDWSYSQGFDHISFNVLSQPEHFNIRSLSIEEKQKIIDKFKSIQTHDILRTIVQLLNVDVTKTTNNT